MSEFKVGDWVVLQDCLKADTDFSIFEVEQIIDGYYSERRHGLKGTNLVLPAGVIRHATPQEITAGHRIDEPQADSDERLMEMPVSISVDLTEKSTFEWARKDAVREAFISKAKELGIYYGASETGEFFSTETRAGWEFWNARQAEIDQLQHQSNEQVELSLIYEGALQEKQKRIDELEKNIKAMINHFAYSRDLAREEWKKRPDAYQDGKSDAYAMSHQWAEKALGSK